MGDVNIYGHFFRPLTLEECEQYPEQAQRGELIHICQGLVPFFYDSRNGVVTEFKQDGTLVTYLRIQQSA